MYLLLKAAQVTVFAEKHSQTNNFDSPYSILVFLYTPWQKNITDISITFGRSLANVLYMPALSRQGFFSTARQQE
jgi:hypothetical protein